MLLIVLTMGFVSATDENVTSDNLAVCEEYNVSSVDEEILNEAPVYFYDVTNLIDSYSAGSVLEIDNEVIYNDWASDGITVSKSITIDGKGNTFDAKGKDRIFNVRSDDVTLKNIVFKNGYKKGYENSNKGAAIYINGYGGCVIENCTFINCSSGYGNGVVYISDSSEAGISCTIANCSFLDCYTDAICVNNNGMLGLTNCKIIDCSFTRIGARSIELSTDFAEGGNLNCSVEGCSFFNLTHNAIDVSYSSGACNITCRVADCSFRQCQDSAISFNDDVNAEIINCNFSDCSAQYGGAIYCEHWDQRINCSVIGCTFLNCRADENGGAIHFGGCSTGVIQNCRFSGCSACYGGAVYAFNEVIVRIITSDFENNHASESGAAISGATSYVFDCTFKKNTSPESETSNNPKDMIPNELIPQDKDCIFTVEFPKDAEGTLELFVNGNFVDVVKIVNGIAKIDLSKYKGVNVISFVYSGDANYPSFEKEASFITTIISANNVNVVYLSGKSYSITVYEFEGIIADQYTQIVIKSNNKAFKTIKTNSKGVASFKITQVPGTYKLSITSLNRTVTKTLTVKHLVALKSVSVKRSAKKLILQASLAKVNGKYLKNKKITFKFNGKKYSAKTNKKGVAKLTIKSKVLKKLKVGKKITYQATYSKDTIKKTVKVKK